MRKLCTLSATVLLVSVSSVGFAEDADSTEGKDQPKAADPAPSSTPKTTSTGSKPTASSTASAPKHVAILKDAKAVPGLINVYQKGSKLYAELSSSNYASEYIVLLSIARGIGQGDLLGGMSWGFGDDWVWKFRKIDDKVHIIRRNVRFKATKGSPEASAVKNAYTDSVLFALPIMTKGPKGGDLIDMTPVFMSDTPQISRALRGFSFSASKSTWASVKGFKDNVELQVAATYASSGSASIETVADSRGVTINVHYSISKVPTTGYQPRLADGRVGYFLTVLKDYSKKSQQDQFIRYVNRWNLQKADPSAPISPPKEPIVFWLEKTVPFKYRKPIRDGILEWNKAFEKAGFYNAIEVRQQPDDADWDPEDVNYNTFRWITSSAGFAMGPSRVNPYTGQILDADIIFDADFLTFWKDEYEVLVDREAAHVELGQLPHKHGRHDCMLNHGMAPQLALGATAILAQADPKQAAQQQEKLIMQALKEVTMHEVGHTLGLRHNFIASTWLSLKDLNEPKDGQAAMVASVMDYNPVNVVPKGWKQGDFYPQTIGPYDYWVIEYGYKPFSGGTSGEVKELQKIAARSGEPGLNFTTDEDTTGSDPEPDSNRFDLGKDTVEYAKLRAQLVKELIPGIVDRMTEEGDDYVQARRAFNILLNQRGSAMSYAARQVGGLHTSRSHKGDKDAKPPITVVDPKTQRAALKMLETELFSDAAYQFPPEIYNNLGPMRWRHWGSSPTSRKDFPVHDFFSRWQETVLSQLLSSTNLERIHDTELKVAADQDAFTTAELIETLTASIFSEVDSTKKGDYTNRKPAISSLRRNLQRNYLRRLSSLAMGRTFAPDDCQTIAFAELSSLKDRINTLLGKNFNLDSYSRAHLQETSSRIEKVLDARLTLSSP